MQPSLHKLKNLLGLYEEQENVCHPQLRYFKNEGLKIQKKSFLPESH